jgi:hypothetical protein
MKNFFDVSAVQEIKDRINALSDNSVRNWGKMNVTQMLAHCTEGMKMAIGDRNPPRLLLGQLVGWTMKSIYFNEKPFPHNNPTHKSFIITSTNELITEKRILIEWIERFYEGGAAKCTTNPHPFFGYFTPEQWAIGMYKHLDHHLRQFSV